MTFESIKDSIQNHDQARLTFQHTLNHTREEYQNLLDRENEFAANFSECCKSYIFQEICSSLVGVSHTNAEIISCKIFGFCYGKYHSLGYLAVLEECEEQISMILEILKLVT